MDELRQEFRRLIPRRTVAIILAVFAIYNGHALRSDPNPGAKAGRWASEFNTLANACFILVIIRTTMTPLVMESIRETRESCDAILRLGSISLLLSLAFSTYLRYY